MSIETLEELAKSLIDKTWTDFYNAVAAAREARKVEARPMTIGEERIVIRGMLCEIKAEGDRWCVKSSRWILKRNGRWNSWATLVPEDCFETAEVAVKFR